MTRIFVEYFGWSCVIVTFGAAFCQIFLTSRMKRDIIRDRHIRPDLAIEMYNDWKVIRGSNWLRDWKMLRLHKTLFPVSRKRQLLFVLQVIMLFTMFAYLFHDQILFTLFHSGR